MTTNCVGISDISIYLPKNRILLDSILSQRIAESPDQELRLRRAVESTDQKAIRFPAYWEDSAVLGGNATLRLLRQQADRIDSVRYFVVGTETTADLSKSMSAYIQGMLDQTDLPLPTRITSFQVQHACAGATLGMLSVAGLLQAAGRDGDAGIVTAADIARYEAPSTAEITQGAGSASMLIERNPRLVALELETQGFSSKDVDDFFRPLGSVTAKVKGRYSVQCYNDALEEAFADFCERSELSPRQALEGTDYFVFHVPFARMASTAVRRLLSNHLGLGQEEATNRLEQSGFLRALEVTAHVGNMYTAAIYLNLMATLHQEYQRIGNDIVGKKILFSSYGSGNTMVVFSGRVMEDAPLIISQWKADDYLNHFDQKDFPAYQAWLERKQDSCCHSVHYQDLATAIEADSFFLETIREDGYRNYRYKGK